MPNPVAEVVERLRAIARTRCINPFVPGQPSFAAAHGLTVEKTTEWIAADLLERLSRERDTGVPEGFCLVPKEPTVDMAEVARDWAQRDWKAFGQPHGYLKYFLGIYRAMLSAAPQPPQTGVPLADRVCHDEQLSIWAEELLCELECWIEAPETYDDGVQCAQAAKQAIKAIVTTAFDLAAAPQPPTVSTQGWQEHFDGEGWVYFNPDSGEEYSPDHPKEAGICDDAEHIRKSTGQEDVLWKSSQEQFQRAELLARERDQAREALEPFSRMADSHDEDRASLVVASKLGTIICVYDLRRARSVLHPNSTTDKEGSSS